MSENERSFQGFPVAAFAFLSELAKNNNKSWFDENRARYKELVEAPAKLFVRDMLNRMQHIFPDIKALDGKLFRVYRDTRFSKDKTPYKTHIGMLFSESPGRACAEPVFYVHIEPKRLSLVTGVKEMDAEMLRSYRDAVANGKKGKRIEAILGTLLQQGISIRSEQYKCAPSGYDPNHKRADLLRNKSLYAERDSSLPRIIHATEFTDHCLVCFSQTKPLYDWLKGVRDFLIREKDAKS